jgi:hypothetical protein
MATRAERFRAAEERSGPKRPKKPVPAPPRKSTRRSKPRQKEGTPLKAREELVVSSPAQRHLTKK